MNRYFLLCIFTIMVFHISAQPRVDAQQQYKVLKSSPIVTNIVGWAYDEHVGKWAGYYNTIWGNYKRNNKTPIKTTAHNMSFNENIVSLQIKKILYKNTVYYALVKVHWTGGFYYPTISEDWYKLQERSIYIYDSTRYQKFFNLTSEVTVIRSYCRSTEHSVSEWTLTDQLKQIFNGKELERDKYPSELYFKREDNNTIRFLHGYSKIKEEEKFTKKYYEIKDAVLNSLLIK